MNKHRVLMALLKPFAILLVFMGVLLFFGELMHGVVPTGANRDTYTMNFPNFQLLPFLWRSGEVKLLLHLIMISLSVLGVLRIGVLLLNGREKLRKVHNDRIQQIGHKAASD